MGVVVVDEVWAIIDFIILIWGRARKCFCWLAEGGTVTELPLYLDINLYLCN